MPALAPADRPDEDLDDGDESDAEGEVAAAAPPAPVVVEELEPSPLPLSNPVSVTLKQGTWPVKSVSATKVYTVRMEWAISSNLAKTGGAYNIRTCVKGLVLVVVLALVDGPVLQLDSRVGSGSDGAGDVVDLVALVAGNDLGDVVDDLFLELGLARGV